MTLLALVCPACASALPAAPERRVLACRDCGRSWRIADGVDRLLPVPRAPVRPRHRPPDGAELLLLPVWRVKVRTEDLAEVAGRLPREVRIPAVGVQRLPLLVQFARNLSRAPLVLEEWEDVQVAVEAAELGAEDAFTLAETVVLRHVDGWPDDASLPTLEIPLSSAHLVDWPCARWRSELIDLVGGLSAPRAMIDAAGLVDRGAALRGALDRLGTGLAG